MVFVGVTEDEHGKHVFVSLLLLDNTKTQELEGQGNLSLRKKRRKENY